MKVFIMGVSGAVGRLPARDHAERGGHLAGPVRREEQRADLSRWDVDALRDAREDVAATLAR